MEEGGCIMHYLDWTYLTEKTPNPVIFTLASYSKRKYAGFIDLNRDDNFIDYKELVRRSHHKSQLRFGQQSKYEIYK